MAGADKTSETSLWEKVMQFVSFWLSVLVLITGGLWLYFRSEIEADTEDFIPWAWGKVTGDSLGIFLAALFCSCLQSPSTRSSLRNHPNSQGEVLERAWGGGVG